MKKILCLLVVILPAGSRALAQDYPRAENFLGFDYVRANSATNVPAFSMNGGGGQFALNFNRWFGAVADLGAVHNGNMSGYQVDTTITNFLLGPRFTIRKSSRVTPYFQILWGGVYAASSTAVPIPEGTPTNPIVIPPPVAVTPHGGTGTIPLRATKDQTAFAMAVGGGLDIKISRVVSFRLIGLDYYLTRLQNYRSADDNNQHNLRYTTGLNFTFGGEKPAPVTAAAPSTPVGWQ